MHRMSLGPVWVFAFMLIAAAPAPVIQTYAGVDRDGTIEVLTETLANGKFTTAHVTLSPGSALTGQPANVVALATATWTPAVIAAYKAKHPK